MDPAVLKTEGRLVRSNASLQIYGVELDFDTIARELATSATRTLRKGEPTRSGKVTQNDLWSVSSPLERSSRLEEHVEWLVNMLQAHSASLRVLTQEPNVRRINIFSSITIDGECCDLQLSHWPLMFLAGLGIGMEFSLVFLNLSNSHDVMSELRESESSSFPKANSLKTESGVSVTVLSRDSSLHRTLSPLGLRFDKTREATDAGVFQVPLSELEDLDSQLKWLTRTLSQSESLVSKLTQNVDITCRFATESEWGGTWLSGEALRISAQLRVPLGFNFRLL